MKPTELYVVVYAPAERTSTRSPSAKARGSSYALFSYSTSAESHVGPAMALDVSLAHALEIIPAAIELADMLEAEPLELA